MISCRVDFNESYRNRFLALMSESSARMLQFPDDRIDDAITGVLGDLGRFLDADRCYVFQFHSENHFMDNTHEWCAEGVNSEKDNLRGLPVDLFPWWMAFMMRNELLYIPEVDGLPPEAAAEREVLSRQQIRSLVAIPLFASGKVFGFIGLDAVRHCMKWQPESLDLLRVAGNIIISAILRHRSNLLLNEELDLALKIRESGSLRETLSHCLDTALAVAGMPSGGIYLIHPDDSVELVVHKGISEEFAAKVRNYAAGSEPHRWIISRTPLYLRTAELVLPDTGYVLKEGLDTIAIIPIIYREHVVACMNIASPYAGGFPEHLRKQLETIASHMGSAIYLARKDEELKQATFNLKTLFNTIDIIIFVCDLNGRIIATNDTAVSRTGYSNTEIIGRSIIDLIPTADTEVISPFLGSTPGSRIVSKKGRILKLSGGLIPVEISVSQSLWDNRSALICVCRDITERQKAEELLRATMRMKEGLLGRFERVSALRNRLIESLNSASVERILQLTLDEAEQMTDSSLGFFHFVQNHYAPGLTHVWSTKTVMRHGSLLSETQAGLEELIGSRFWSAVLERKEPLVFGGASLGREVAGFPERHPGISTMMVVPVVRDERVMAILVVGNRMEAYDEESVRWVRALADQAWEIVENKLYLARQTKLQEQLQHAKKMETIGRLAAGIAHEINNPLNFVRFNLVNLENDFRDLLDWIDRVPAMHPDSAAAYALPSGSVQAFAPHQEPGGLPGFDELLREIPDILNETRRGVERITGIIRSMRNFTYDQRPDAKESFDINNAVRDVFAIAANECSTVALLESELATVPPVFCNALQINQVILNLIMNGIHAIRSQKRGTTGRIRVRTWEDDSSVCCSVFDDGPGIPEPIRSKVFDPFFTTKEPREGTGLGLSISYDIIVHKHQGTLSFECPQEGGTIFTFSLPRY